ncbi:hypothetical protein [Thiocystis violacea]|uniref:hypothetical protein n=1 Tax=Thiocystis violacea TaxID=13725 RepID=UPI0019061BB3|nr:hypothetical protein [Thiocystis violacea]MBK1719444.1 hypothetical protein [Thiocystis violacea]
MKTLIPLVLWTLGLGLAGWRPHGLGQSARWSALILAGLTLALSPFWREVARGLLGSADPLMAGPEAVYPAVWILALAPILRRRIDARALGETLLTGLIAAAMLGLALDVDRLASAGLGVDRPAQALATVLTLAILAILFLAGLAARRLIGDDRLPWEDYPAWYAGLLLMHQAAAPLPIAIDLGAGHGVWTIAGAMIPTLMVWRYLSPGPKV